jgi:hypothetical protein
MKSVGYGNMMGSDAFHNPESSSFSEQSFYL